MQEIIKRALVLKSELDIATDKIGLAKLRQDMSKLSDQSNGSGLWDNPKKAQKVMQDLARLKTRVDAWDELIDEVKSIQELAKSGDQTLQKELNDQIGIVEKKFAELKHELKFAGEHDRGDAIISIFAGAGGTDAQDWSEMIERMYLRYLESNNFKVELIDRSTGDEAGIKSSTMLVKGDFAYGKLRGEDGVHRLVRLSPYNSDNLRQTSFARVEVLPQIDDDSDIDIDPKDLKIDVYRAGGHGGQSVNTTDSAVRITHLPTGFVVSIQNERSQLQNKETAMTILRSKLVSQKEQQQKESIDALKSPNKSAEWGNQIRSYVLHPYKQVKDLRTKHESSDPEGVLNGDIEEFIEAYLEKTLT